MSTFLLKMLYCIVSDETITDADNRGRKYERLFGSAQAKEWVVEGKMCMYMHERYCTTYFIDIFFLAG